MDIDPNTLSKEQIDEISRELLLKSLMRGMDETMPRHVPKDIEPGLRSDDKIRSIKDIANALGRRQDAYDPAQDQQQLKSRGTRFGNALYNAMPNTATEKIADFMDDAYGFFKDPYQVSGAQFAEDGITKSKEGYDEGDPYKMAGGAMMTGLAAMPYGGKIAGKALSTVPGYVGTGIAAGFGPDLADGVFSNTEAYAGKNETPAYKQQAEKMIESLNKQKAQALSLRDSAEADMQKELQSGKGPKYEAAARRFQQISNEMNGLDEQLSKFNHMLSPEYEYELNKRKENERRAADAEFWSKPTREISPLFGPAATAVGVTASGVLANALTRGRANKFNTGAEDISKRWKKAVDDANQTDDFIKAEIGANKAQEFARQYDRLDKSTNGPGFSAYLAGQAFSDVGVAAPEIADEIRGIESDTDWKDFLKRMGYASILSMGAVKGGSNLGSGEKKYFPRYDAETGGLEKRFERDIADRLLNRTGKDKYKDKGFQKEVMDAEEFYSSRRDFLSSAAHTSRANDMIRQDELQLLSTQKDRQSLAKALSRQGKQTQRQRNQGQSLKTSKDLSKNDLAGALTKKPKTYNQKKADRQIRDELGQFSGGYKAPKYKK